MNYVLSRTVIDLKDIDGNHTVIDAFDPSQYFEIAPK